MITTEIWIFILAMIVVIILAVYHVEKPNYNRIPKKIWSYWSHPDRIPKTIKMCIESWKKHNPDYQIVLMNKNTYKGYVNIPEEVAKHPNFHNNNFSDLLRLYTLA